MIKWDEIRDLHVISKLEEILGKWFGVEQFYTDTHYKVRSNHLEKDFGFSSHLMKIQMNVPHGYDWLCQDIEKVSDKVMNSETNWEVFDSFIPHVKGVAAKVVIDGQFMGCVFAYPFISDSISDTEYDEVVKFLSSNGASEGEAKACVEHVKKLGGQDVDYLKELVDLVADEVVTFYEEITKREEIIHELNSELGDKYRYHTMIGKSKKMQQIYRLLEKISSSESSVLINGENGTGKELVAKAIHYTSPRKDSQFLAVNCSAFNDNLLDSELFGHVKGAFTGAIKDKKGLFETANGGTLFLDEIGDTSLTMQVKLLRVLQEGTYLPVGATSPKRADVRIVAATNKNLKDMMAKSEFREDLFYRINVINVQLPPLRDRNEDISVLLDHFLKKKM